MREQLRHKLQEEDMSATILSAFYDFEMLYKQDKSLNINAIHLNSMLDKKAVGAPVSTSSASSSCSYAPGFFRRNSISSSSSSSSADSLSNSNKFPANVYSNLKESGSASTAAMNKENKFRDRAYSETGERSQQLQVLQQKPGSQINSTRYKTELCRPFEESGACKYGEKCQFAHGYHELRSLSRHPKYKTEPCRTFHTIGFCPYGPRCHFIHNADERRPAPPANANAGVHAHSHAHAHAQGDAKSAQRELCTFAQRERPKLHHSLSFSGFSNHHGLESALLENPTSRTPPPASSCSSCSSSSCSSSSSSSNSSCSPAFYEEVLSPGSVSCVSSAFSFPGQELKSLLAPLAVHTQGAYCGNLQNGAYYAGNLQNGVCAQALRRLSESPVFDSPPSPHDSLSDRDSYASGSLSSSGSLSGSESPSLDAGRRLPIFSRLSISDE